MYCKKCQAEIKDTAKFCPVCGAFTNETPVTEELGKPKVRYCPKCQRKLAVGETVCAVCNSTENSEKPSKKAQRKRPAIRKGFLIAASLALIAVAVLGVLGYLMRDFLVGWKVQDGVLTLREHGLFSSWQDADPAPWEENKDEIHTVIIKDGVTEIGTMFSNYTNISVVEIPGSVKIIDPYAFRACTSLSKVNLSEGVKMIGEGAFINCTLLSSITLPRSLTEIGAGAFSCCKSLSAIALPDGLTTIGDVAFSDCVALKEIKIPDSVTCIGDYAFSSCEQLSNVYISNRTMDIGRFLFSNCNSLFSISIPDGVTKIEYLAFYCCNNLKEITIPDSVTCIEYAFYGCKSLTQIYYTGTEEEWNAIDIQDTSDEFAGATVHFNS